MQEERKVSRANMGAAVIASNNRNTARAPRGLNEFNNAAQYDKKGGNK